MFFLLSKTLFYLLMPMTWIVGLLVAAVWVGNERRRKRLIVAATILLFVFGNNFLVNEAFSAWEIPATPIAKLPGTYDVGIVLTGITNIEQTPRDRVYFNKGADRLLHALQLYRMGKIRHILITGGSGNVVGSQESEAEELASVLRLCGVPKRAITLENKARNTRENALFSAAILRQQFTNKSYLLITSAFHMRRAEGCFTQARVPVTVFSTDFYTQPRKFTPDRLLIPSESALSKWYVLCHEILGYVMYRVMGYA